MKTKTIIYLLFTSIILTSCQFIHINDNKSLGDGYYYVYDKPSSIIYSKENNKGRDGTLVIPSSIEMEVDYSSSVISYNFNQKYIIAKTKDEKQSVKYWLLEKSTYNIEEPLTPLDSIQFYRMLSEKAIELKFKE
ncbi:MAG: hypothetical protein CVU01_01255 [Bacteroidetes bacterium HGW-Bacteroidetes-18]|nr:MAG: hypothetical protein CVU01_01255 [Bacteroidetes bacterium HGW-Bacteroidetes-18]